MSPARSALLAAAIAVCAVSQARAQVSFAVDFDTSASSLTSTQRSNITGHVQAAGRRWVEEMDIAGARSIEVRIFLDNVPTANARSTTTAFVGRLENRDTFEQGAAHELRTGTDPNGATHDVEITFGTDYLRDTLWFDPAPLVRTATIPADRVDAMSVVLHELGHAFAYNGWASGANATPMPTYWSNFDSWIAEGSATVLPVFGGANAIAAWGSAPDLTRYNVHHWGNPSGMGLRAEPMAKQLPAVLWHAGAPQPHAACDFPVAHPAPPTGHRHAKVEPEATLIDELMNGVVYYLATRYAISDLDRGVLRDLGLASDGRIFSSGFEALQ